MTNTAQTSDAEIAVYVGLGSNLGDREANLREAIDRIKALGLEIRKESSVYETEPVGLRDQPWFLNQVIEALIVDVLSSEHGRVLGGDSDTIATIQADALLFEFLKIEHEMGRERVVANGPRVIDIDLLLFGDGVIAHSEDDEWPFTDPTDVFVPHPRMHLRRFVLEPLCEIAPFIVHPALKKTCREILTSLDDPSMVRLYERTKP
jgi:2-amino-4-hydroxy-6-hydroxymethyldihydropteridine diphosphokinase